MSTIISRAIRVYRDTTIACAAAALVGAIIATIARAIAK